MTPAERVCLIDTSYEYPGWQCAKKLLTVIYAWSAARGCRAPMARVTFTW